MHLYTVRYKNLALGKFIFLSLEKSRYQNRHFSLLEVDWARGGWWHPAVHSGVALRVGVGMSYSTLWIPRALSIIIKSIGLGTLTFKAHFRLMQ